MIDKGWTVSRLRDVLYRLPEDAEIWIACLGSPLREVQAGKATVTLRTLNELV